MTGMLRQLPDKGDRTAPLRYCWPCCTGRSCCHCMHHHLATERTCRVERKSAPPSTGTTVPISFVVKRGVMTTAANVLHVCWKLCQA